jgi:hypothetical protein
MPVRLQASAPARVQASAMREYSAINGMNYT